MARVCFVTLFPALIRSVTDESIFGRAQAAGHVRVETANPRDFTTDKHRTVDDSPFGGEPGMLLKAEPVALAIESLSLPPGSCVIDTNPAAPIFTQQDALNLSQESDITFLCGHYEGIDARVAKRYATHTFSLGDYVITGGELAALVMADAIVRQLPGVLGNAASLQADCFSDGLLAAENYTRPEVWRGEPVPPVLVSGHHAQIAKWRRQESLRLTARYRPELLKKATLTKSDRQFLESLDRPAADPASNEVME